MAPRRNGHSYSLGTNKQVLERKRNGSLFKIFFMTLIAVAVSLSVLAVNLTHQLSSSSSENSSALPRSVAASESSSSVSRAIDKKPSAAIEIPPPLPNNNNNGQLLTPGATRNNGKYAQDRVYCMVPFVWNEEYYTVIMQTWGKRCDVIKFFTDSVVLDGGKIQGDEITEDPMRGYKPYYEFEEGTFPQNVVFMNMTRPWTGCKDKETGKPKICRHIWEKMWRSWVYVGDYDLDKAEWFCKVDYDTFLFPENLQYYVHDYKKWDPFNEHHYFGHYLSHRGSRAPLIAGACACWSHKTMHDIAEVYRTMPKGYKGDERGKCEDRAGATEEVSTSLCLKDKLDVTAEAARDEEMREYVMVDPYHNHLTWNRTEQGEWWFWKGKPANAGQLEDCCARRPIAFHKYKVKKQMEELEHQFYGSRGAENEEYNKLKEAQRRYVDKVRDAMGTDA
eukprot:g4848.t1 g4848   contig18:57135-58478(-)